jgi:hypothetical protein
MGTIVSDVSTDGSRSMELRMYVTLMVYGLVLPVLIVCMVLIRTRSFVCEAADLVEPSDTPPTPKLPCTFRVSPSFQPVEVKTSFTFDSRPKFIPAEASQAPLSKPQPQPSRVHQGKSQATPSTPETSQSTSKPIATKVPRDKSRAARRKPSPHSSDPAPHNVTSTYLPRTKHRNVS